jgi:Ti-type conjugative transfer relaxase TraA
MPMVAIYHLSAKIISRSTGRSVVAAAAYRSGQELTDRSTGLTHDYTRKSGVEHTEILAPDGAPAWVYDRAELWNRVEQAEKRKDAQLAREVEAALPVECSNAEQVALVRDFARRAFVSRGMVVDVGIHRDNPDNPHAHLLLTMRDVSENGFGAKRRDWNERELLVAWREQWAEIANEHLLRHQVRIDHRSLRAQGSELDPGRKIGVARDRQAEADLPADIRDKAAEQRAIARANGARILADPGIALRGITHQQATFTERDIARYLHGRTDGAEQFQAAYLKVTTSSELVKLGVDDRRRVRYTTKEMLELERGLLRRAERLAAEQGAAVGAWRIRSVLASARLSQEQANAVRHVTGGERLAVVVGVAGSGKSTLLDAARRAWEGEGLSVKGATLSGIAAQNLEQSSGMRSRTLASWSYSWEQGRDGLTARDVLVIDEAGMLGTRQLARVLEHVEKARAKVVLIGDPEQLQAIEAGAPFRAIADRGRAVELTEVRRQRLGWQREATRALSTGETSTALGAYEQEHRMVAVPTREQAREQLLRAWAKADEMKPGESRLMLAYTREDVQLLNDGARASLAKQGRLGADEEIQTERGSRAFASGDRIVFLRNERSLGVRNGSLGSVERVMSSVLHVRLDGGERVAFDAKRYRDLDHGYALTIHKAQGTTVDRAYVLATPHLDRHSAYVALTRHREAAAVFYGEDDFRRGEGHGASDAARETLHAVLSRARPKELAHDYLVRNDRTAHNEPSLTSALEKSQSLELDGPEL